MDLHPQPAGGAPRPWAFPAPERTTLDNGLTVLTCHRPGQQVVAVEVLLDSPLDTEPEGLDGLATIMARAFSEGTDRDSAEEFAAELERCGATLDAFADHPGVRLSLEVPVSRLEKALGLLADALRAPAFAEAEIERLVRNRLDEIPHEQANPARRAAKELSRQLFPAGSRVSRPRQGTEETVERIDAAAVRAFYERHVRPATATAVIVGDLEGTDLGALLAGSLGAWQGDAGQPNPVPAGAPPHPPPGGPGRPPRPRPPPPGHRPRGPPPAPPPRPRRRAAPPPHDRVWPAQVLGTYSLGGTLTSRLDRVLREEKGYTYGVRSFAQVLRSTPEGTGAAMLAISGSVDTESTGPALDDLWKVLRTLAAEGLTDAELDTAVQNLVGVAPLKYETAAAVASTLADQVEQHLPDDFQARLYRMMTETGATEATAAVVSAFPADRLVTVLVGDASRSGRRGAARGERGARCE
ncbi:M16 family metallopeptidase [Streptomyces albidoflavus]